MPGQKPQKSITSAETKVL